MITFKQLTDLFQPPPPPGAGRAAPGNELPEGCEKVGDLPGDKSLWVCKENSSHPITDGLRDLANDVGGLFSKGLNYYKGLLLGGRHGMAPLATPPPGGHQLRTK